MALSNWAFAATFAAAIVGCLIVLAIVWVRRPKQDGWSVWDPHCRRGSSIEAVGTASAWL